MIINIKTNKDNVIISYAVVGKVKGGVDVDTGYTNIDDVPPLSAGYYKLIDGTIAIDENLKAQIEIAQ